MDAEAEIVEEEAPEGVLVVGHAAGLAVGHVVETVEAVVDLVVVAAEATEAEVALADEGVTVEAEAASVRNDHLVRLIKAQTL